MTANENDNDDETQSIGGGSSEWSLSDIEDAPAEASSEGITDILEEELAANGVDSFTSVPSAFDNSLPDHTNLRPHHSVIPEPPTDLFPTSPTLFDAQPTIDAFGRHIDTIELLEELDQII